ncbi:HAD family hydrolase [Fuscovulum blasticum]|uniref:HAD family hydrolase n=1 Tax=Fuscovulum blasticum TaxID=1075 RepID=UPI000D3EA0A9|nr:HAD family hydrolase [Fuscovulum blasticum]AWD22998.1 phosphoglycolate phosphatase [Fuscovulum blasticum]
MTGGASYGVLRRPVAVVFDLDDTLLTAYRTPERTWAAIIAEHADALGEHDSRWVTANVLNRVLEFLSRDEGRKMWRLEGDATRRQVVRSAFHRLNLARPPGSEPLHGVDADRIADRFETFLEETIRLKPGARDMLDQLTGQGLRLALLTNGSGPRQRDKITRFDLEKYFQIIRIEEEVGVGKPEAAAYSGLLADLGLPPARAWMVGDDPVWDVTAAAEAGMTAIFYSEDPLAPTPAKAAARISTLEDLPPLVVGADQSAGQGSAR